MQWFIWQTPQVEKVLGHNTPAHKAGLQGGDVLVNVQGELVTMMTHPQVEPALD
jgi:C-terminal processing protease CtpA/Prc